MGDCRSNHAVVTTSHVGGRKKAAKCRNEAAKCRNQAAKRRKEAAKRHKNPAHGASRG